MKNPEQKGKGIVSAKEWDSGSSTTNGTEKATKVLSFLETLEKNAGANMKAIAKGTGLTWPYSTVQALVKAGTVEEKKIGKAKFFRVK